jgi:hypothetical protein
MFLIKQPVTEILFLADPSTWRISTICNIRVPRSIVVPFSSILT